MSTRSRQVGWYALGLLACANLLHYANRNVFFHNAVYEDLEQRFQFTETELGFLGSMAFMVPHAFATLGVGWLGDRFDRRRVMAIGVVVWSVGAVACGSAIGFWSLLAARALVGVGCAACVPVANAVICDVYAHRGKGTAVSMFNLGLFLGGVVGFGIGGLVGFPTSFYLVAVPGFALAYLIAVVDVPSSGERSAPVAPDAVSWPRFSRDMSASFRHRTLRWMYVGAVLMAFSAGGYLGWFTPLLAGPKGMSNNEATMLLGLALIGGLAGVVTGGRVGDRLAARMPHGRQLTVAIGLGAAVPFALGAIFLDRGPLFYVCSMLLMYFSMWYHAPVAAGVDDLVPPERAATSQGVYIFLMHLFGTAPSSWAVGKLVREIGLEYALLLPTAAMVLAVGAFAMSCAGVRADLVVKRHET